MATLSFDSAALKGILDRFRNNSQIFEPLHPPIFGGFNPSEPDEVSEQAALLYSILNAGDRYRLVSLGAAPGEWAIKAERGYRMVHPDGDFASFCLEGDLDHFELTQNFIAGNGGNPADHNIQYKVIADRDGYAYFPIINPDIDWGAGIAAIAETADALDANMTITDVAKADRIGANGGKPLEYRTVEAVSLATLLGQTGTVDFLHSDIQGAESDVFPAQMPAMNAHVKLVCIGTHGKQIEQQLVTAFSANGWKSECAFTCHTVGEGEAERVLKDGVFVWSNPAFAD